MTLGQVIRDARIAARLSIEQVSESTSVRIGLLTEMENNNLFIAVAIHMREAIFAISPIR